MNIVGIGTRGSQLTASLFYATALLMAAGTYAGQDADDGFNPNANNPVYTLAVQPDGKILVGGLFGTIGGGARTRVARILSNGRLDTSFDPGIIAGTAVSISVYALALQSDDKVVISGEFDEVADQERMNIARLNADGSLDAAFNPGANSTAYALKIQPDGKIIVGGLFSSLGGQAKKCIGRLNADGSLDTAFNPTTDGIILSIALQADGKIVVGGWFTLMDNQPRQSIARLNADGTLDSTFLQTNSANDDVHCDVQCLAIQADGKIIIGGDFAAIDGQERNNIARLNADGSLDTTFDPNANNPVWDLDNAEYRQRIVIRLKTGTSCHVS